MSQGEKIAAYVGAVIVAIVIITPASRDYVIELGTIVGALVWFGLLVVWNAVLSLNWMVTVGVVLGAAYVGAVVVSERAKNRL